MSEASSQLWTGWAAVAGGDDESRAVWTELVERWSEPHRHYHGLHHLVFMLTFLQRFEPIDDATILAAWLHDAVYQPTSVTNEADSAELAGELLRRIGRDQLVDRVRELVLLTVSHEVADGDAQAAALLDADLAILGQDPAIYLRYVEGVRREYAHVPDGDFIAARSEIMQGFIDRDRIYYTDLAHNELDAAARRNISAELAVYRDRPTTA